jgi:hypothetical protein
MKYLRIDKLIKEGNETLAGKTQRERDRGKERGGRR